MIVPIVSPRFAPAAFRVIVRRARAPDLQRTPDSARSRNSARCGRESAENSGRSTGWWRKTDDLRPCAEDRHQRGFFHFRPPHRTCPGAAGRSTRWPISVTRSSVLLRFVMLWVWPGSMWTASIFSPLTANSRTSSRQPPLMDQSVPSTTMKNSHLLWCQCWPLVTPGFVIFTENCPQLRVFQQLRGCRGHRHSS